MAAAYFIAVPCELNTAHRLQKKNVCFFFFFAISSIHCINNNVEYVSFEVLRVFVCIFRGVLRAFLVLRVMDYCNSRHLFR